MFCFFFFQAEDGIRDADVTGVQTCALPISGRRPREITGITDREREVLRLVGLGMSNAEIAAALYITAGTAKTHVARLLAKLGARDRVQLVITAYEAGLVL